jgi:hypothetical protein
MEEVSAYMTSGSAAVMAGHANLDGWRAWCSWIARYRHAGRAGNPAIWHGCDEIVVDEATA